MFVHLPGEPGTLQLRHAPSQALWQQTPSTQKPDSHWLASVQEAPGFTFPHRPVVVLFTVVATHWCPAWQSLSLRQELLQAPLAHKKGAQSTTWASRQVPCPSQTRAVFSVTLDAQVAAPHGVFSGNTAQAPEPSQRPVVPHVEALLAGQRESDKPAPTSLQRPRALGSLQVRQAPVQATLQQ